MFASLASLFDNLIQAVNIVGSLFYGVILGIFFTAFFLRRVGSTAVFIAGILSEAVIVGIYILREFGYTNIAYLWLNLIGCLLVMGLSLLLQERPKKPDMNVIDG
jgi:glycopeptide antibiotics resistance protein